MHDSDSRPVVLLGRKLQQPSAVSLRSSNSWRPQTRRQRNAPTCFFSPFMSSSLPSRGLEIQTLEIVGEEESVATRKDNARNLLIKKPNDQTAFQQLQNARSSDGMNWLLGWGGQFNVPVQCSSEEARSIWLDDFCGFLPCSVLLVFLFMVLFCCLFKTSLHVAQVSCSCFCLSWAKTSYVTSWISTSRTTGLNWWRNLASVTCYWIVERERERLASQGL